MAAALADAKLQAMVEPPLKIRREFSYICVVGLHLMLEALKDTPEAACRHRCRRSFL
jgi:hypothetical protein